MILSNGLFGDARVGLCQNALSGGSLFCESGQMEKMMKLLAIAFLCCLFTLQIGAGTIVGMPQTVLPSAGSTVTLTPAFPIGPNSYLMPINLLAFDVIGTAIFQYTTDGLPGASVYTIPLAYNNQSASAWDYFTVTLSGGTFESALSLSVPLNMPGNPLVSAGDDVLIDDQILLSGSSRLATIELTFGDTPAPPTFSIEFTPRVAPDVPEPGTVVLGMLLMLTSCRRGPR